MNEELIPECEILSYRLEIRDGNGNLIRVETFENGEINVTEFGNGTASASDGRG